MDCGKSFGSKKLEKLLGDKAYRRQENLLVVKNWEDF
jgi:hypothetical protein